MDEDFELIDSNQEALENVAKENQMMDETNNTEKLSGDDISSYASIYFQEDIDFHDIIYKITEPDSQVMKKEEKFFISLLCDYVKKRDVQDMKNFTALIHTLFAKIQDRVHNKYVIDYLLKTLLKIDVTDTNINYINIDVIVEEVIYSAITTKKILLALDVMGIIERIFKYILVKYLNDSSGVDRFDAFHEYVALPLMRFFVCDIHVSSIQQYKKIILLSSYLLKNLNYDGGNYFKYYIWRITRSVYQKIRNLGDTFHALFLSDEVNSQIDFILDCIFYNKFKLPSLVKVNYCLIFDECIQHISIMNKEKLEICLDYFLNKSKCLVEDPIFLVLFYSIFNTGIDVWDVGDYSMIIFNYGFKILSRLLEYERQNPDNQKVIDMALVICLVPICCSFALINVDESSNNIKEFKEFFKEEEILLSLKNLEFHSFRYYIQSLVYILGKIYTNIEEYKMYLQYFYRINIEFVGLTPNIRMMLQKNHYKYLCANIFEDNDHIVWSIGRRTFLQTSLVSHIKDFILRVKPVFDPRSEIFKFDY